MSEILQFFPPRLLESSRSGVEWNRFNNFFCKNAFLFFFFFFYYYYFCLPRKALFNTTERIVEKRREQKCSSNEMRAADTDSDRRSVGRKVALGGRFSEVPKQLHIRKENSAPSGGDAGAFVIPHLRFPEAHLIDHERLNFLASRFQFLGLHKGGLGDYYASFCFEHRVEESVKCCNPPPPF